MIPIRILLVDETSSNLRERKDQLESLGGFEVITAASPAWGMLCLARHQPDLLLVNPLAGRGTAEEWRRAVQTYRCARSLAVLVIGHRFSAHDRSVLRDLADLEVLEGPYDSTQVAEILTRWAGAEETMSRAA